MYATDCYISAVKKIHESMSQPFNEKAVANMIDDNVRVAERMYAARARMQEQVRAADIQSALIDAFRAERRRTPGLDAAIVALTESNPVLAKYIARLEKVSATIWCSRCDTVKNVPGYNEQRSPSPPAVPSTPVPLPTPAAPLSAPIARSTAEALAEIRAEFEAKFAAIQQAAEHDTSLMVNAIFGSDDDIGKCDF